MDAACVLILCEKVKSPDRPTHHPQQAKDLHRRTLSKNPENRLIINHNGSFIRVYISLVIQK